MIDRRTLQDDVFLHLGMKIILWCVTRRQHARRILMAATTTASVAGSLVRPDNDYERIPEWTVWDKLWKTKKKMDQKRKKKDMH